MTTLAYPTVFCESRRDAETVVSELEGWLTRRGLHLSREKTRIVHLTEGFDFLGFNIRHYKMPNSTKTGYKLLIKPSNDSVKAIRKKLREQWRSLNGSSIGGVLTSLNPVIRGWANYFRIGVAGHTFAALDTWMFRREYRYAKHEHPHKTQHWRTDKYWGALNQQRPTDRWVFGDKHSGAYLLKFRWFNIERHVMVIGNASWDNPRLRGYWASRQKRDIQKLTPRQQWLARNQKYTCPLCGDSLLNGENLEEHHKQMRSQGGGEERDNRALVHIYCHQQIHGGKIQPKDAAGEPLLIKGASLAK